MHESTSSRSALSSRRGFTLIELLVVIIVIALLASMVAPNVFRHVGAAKDATARAQIELLGTALDAYRLDTGSYPSPEQGLEALWTEPQIQPRPIGWRGPYTRKPIPLDPWQNPYIYRRSQDAGRGGYELLSLGADGRAGGDGDDADILSWQ